MSYDAIPYDSTPFAETHPERLAAHARLFGLTPPDPAACRVLEIGCASGGNLIPMAFYLPGSRFLGIDLSATQIDAGQAVVDAVGLTNIELRAGDICDLDAAEGPFDYILCHGVFSWAPPAVRERILALCGSALSEHGILYLSYNTLPGWHSRGMLRQMMLRQLTGVSDPGERLKRAQEWVQGLGAACGALGGIHADFIESEIKRINERPASYLFHEYLEDYNEAFFFSDVAAQCARQGLAYLTDSNMLLDLPVSMPPAAQAFIRDVDDRVELAQQIDFLVGRNFRQSLFCRAGQPVAPEPDTDFVAALAVCSDLTPPKKLDLHRVKEAPFHGEGASWKAFHPLTKAALALLREHYPASLSLPELTAAAERQVLGVGERFFAAQHEELVIELFSLYLGGALQLVPHAGPVNCRVGTHPRAHALARAQAALDLGHAAGRRHTTIGLDPFARTLLLALDGSRDREALLAHLEQAILDHPGLRAEVGDLANPARVRRMLEANSDRLLAFFARQGLLEH